ncbi:MAG: mechanosensitive ion channel family protein [Oscillospiraceae bacterium]
MGNIYAPLLTYGISATASAFLANLISALIVALVCYIAIKIISKIIFKIIEKTHFEQGVKHFLLSAVKVGLWFIAIIIIATKLGIPAASLVALLSVAGLALSLAFQGVLTNLFSGLTVLTTRPFVIGDYVELNGLSGTVSAINLFYTTLKTVDNKMISVPNSEVTSAKVINYSHEARRRLDMTFSASYDDTTENVRAAIMEAVAAQDKILQDPAPFVGLLAYKDSCIDYVLRVWVNNADYWDIYFALNETVRECFAKHGVQMTYNHLNVHMISDK